MMILFSIMKSTSYSGELAWFDSSESVHSLRIVDGKFSRKLHQKT